jgi:hypothetical protein
LFSLAFILQTLGKWSNPFTLLSFCWTWAIFMRQVKTTIVALYRATSVWSVILFEP